MENKKQYWMTVFWVFIIGSIAGYCIEMLVAFVQEGHIESRQGLLYGPFAQVYGLGAVVYFLILPHLGENKIKVFLGSMVLGGIVEFLCSYFQEKWFGTISWDYSHLWFNIQGRTSLLHCLYWGTGGLLFMKFVMPFVEHINTYITQRKTQVITMLCIAFMVWNMGISTMAAHRQQERLNHEAPKNAVDRLLDTLYPDYKMNQIYANKKVVQE